MEYLSLKGGAAVVPASTAFHPKLVVLAVLAYEHLQNEAAYEEKHGHEHDEAGYNEGGEAGHETRVQVVDEDGNDQHPCEQGQAQRHDREEGQRAVVAEKAHDGADNLEAVGHRAEFRHATLRPVAVVDGHFADAEVVFKGMNGHFRFHLEALRE